jgi:hypothetical protein
MQLDPEENEQRHDDQGSDADHAVRTASIETGPPAPLHSGHAAFR